jgi:hypothetical protein
MDTIAGLLRGAASAFCFHLGITVVFHLDQRTNPLPVGRVYFVFLLTRFSDLSQYDCTANLITD